MPTQGEFEYFKNIGEAGMDHASNKPWSDEHCGLLLMELGAIMGLLPSKGKLLDLGCGTGWTSVLFAKRGYEVTGQELVPEAIEAAKKLKDENGLQNLEFIECDFESLPFNKEFDIAVFFDCLHHSLDEVKALEGVYRSLKPGGICITSEPGVGHARSSKEVMAKYGVTERDMNPGKIIRAAKKVGFTSWSVHPHSSHLYLSLYRSREGGRVSKILKLPGMRTLAAIFSLAIYKHLSGIVVLRK